MLNYKKIIVTGGAGFLGSHLIEKMIKEEGVLKEDIFIPRSREYDLRKKEDIEKLFRKFKADLIIHCAISAGNILYNKENIGAVYYDNLVMGANLIDVARKNNVKKFIAIGTALAYPFSAPIPLKESDFWSGYPEETLAPLGIANKMLLVQLQAYRKQYGLKGIYLILANLYGPRDHFSSSHSHVIPSLIKKFDEATCKKRNRIEIWGGGNVSREFLYVEDAAKGIILAIKNYEDLEPLNMGSSEEISIKNLVEKLGKIYKFNGKIEYDSKKPEGQLRRCLDSTKCIKKIGFSPNMNIDKGLLKTIDWFKKNKEII